MRRWLVVLLAAVALHAAVPAAAEGRRLMSAAEAQDWRAVGRLNIGGNRFCTATLIAADLALTAAHCLYHPRTKRRVALGQMRFVAGLRMGAHAAVRRVAAAATLPGYRYDGATSLAAIGSDVALLRLESPVPAAAVRAFDVAGMRRARGGVTLVSYARDRAHAPSIERPCHVRQSVGAVAALSCDVTHGASGAPVFADVDGRPRVVAVISAVGRDADQRRLALAVNVGAMLPELLAALDAQASGRPIRAAFQP